MKKHLFKALCLALTIVVAFSGAHLVTGTVANAKNDFVAIDVTTDKSSYGLLDTVGVRVTVTNQANVTLSNVAVSALSSDYSCVQGNASANYAQLSARQSATNTFSVVLTKNASGLGFFQKLMLFFKYFLRKLPTLTGLGSVNRVQSEQISVNQGGKTRTIEIEVSYSAPPESTTSTTATTTEPGFTYQLQMTVLNVGQGLSVLFQCDGKNMLYDGGPRSASSYVVSYLQNHGVTNLDYMFASHYDEDHIAGLVGVLNTASVSTLVSPNYTASSAIYTSFQNKILEKSVSVVHPYVGQTFSLGEANITVLSPKDYAYSSENSYSVAVRVSLGAFSCILTGDAESEAENDMRTSGQTLQSEIYVVGHHGSSSSSSTAFVQAIQPKYALISCGLNNSYGHPTAKTISTLQNVGACIYRTDLQGEIICYANKDTYRFSIDPQQWATTTTTTTSTTVTTTSTTKPTTSTTKPTTSTTKPTTTTTTSPTVPTTVYYTKTGKKYHYNSKCGSGTYYPCTLSEALARGLTPCEKCVH